MSHLAILAIFSLLPPSALLRTRGTTGVNALGKASGFIPTQVCAGVQLCPNDNMYRC